PAPRGARGPAGRGDHPSLPRDPRRRPPPNRHRRDRPAAGNDGPTATGPARANDDRGSGGTEGLRGSRGRRGAWVRSRAAPPGPDAFDRERGGGGGGLRPTPAEPAGDAGRGRRGGEDAAGPGSGRTGGRGFAGRRRLGGVGAAGGGGAGFAVDRRRPRL